MGRITDACEEFLRVDDWPYERLGDDLLKTGFQGDNANFTCWFRLREEQEQVVFYAVCPAQVPPSRRGAMAEFITRANYGMILGNFEMDFSDGELRYKCSADVEGLDTIPITFLKNMTYAAVLMMDRYFPGIMKVIYGNADPAQAIAEIEG